MFFHVDTRHTWKQDHSLFGASLLMSLAQLCHYAGVDTELVTVVTVG